MSLVALKSLPLTRRGCELGCFGQEAKFQAPIADVNLQTTMKFLQIHMAYLQTAMTNV